MKRALLITVGCVAVLLILFAAPGPLLARLTLTFGGTIIAILESRNINQR
jgi:hypothetical protein